MATRSVLLLATNKPQYLKFALNCAESILLHNPGLPVYIATNIIPGKEFAGITFLQVSEDIAGLFIEAKLYLDTFLQTEETLFIDSDCICYGNLTPLFNACSGMDVTVIGRPVPLEDYWRHEAGFAREEFSIDKSIIFTGAFYYIKKSALTHRIFERARQISTRYDEYGLARIQNKWKNEEELLSIAMVANKQHPIADDATLMTDFSTDRRPQLLNVLTGECVLRNPTQPANQHRSWYPEIYSPIVLHFGGSNINTYPYISQSVLIRLHKMGLPVVLSSAIVAVFIHFPFKTYHWLRRLVKSK